MPVTLSAKFKINSLPYEGFYTAYRAIGRYYQDKELDNANEYILEASLGNEYERQEGSRKRQVTPAHSRSRRVKRPTTTRTTAPRAPQTASTSITA